MQECKYFIPVFSLLCAYFYILFLDLHHHLLCQNSPECLQCQTLKQLRQSLLPKTSLHCVQECVDLYCLRVTPFTDERDGGPVYCPVAFVQAAPLDTQSERIQYKSSHASLCPFSTFQRRKYPQRRNAHCFSLLLGLFLTSHSLCSKLQSCSVQYGSHQTHVTAELLKCDQSKLRSAVI